MMFRGGSSRATRNAFLLGAAICVAPVAWAAPLASTQAILLAPQEQSSALAAGTAALARGDVAAAIPLLERAASDSPGSPEPFFHLGRARLMAGNPEGAAEDLRRAQELGGGFNAAIDYQLGVALMRLGDYAGATEIFERLLEVQPEGLEPLLNLGWIAMQQEQSRRALEIFEEVLARAPDVGLAHYYVGVVHHGNARFTQAAAAYRRAIEAQPDLHDARLALGRLAVDGGDPEAAREHFEAVIAARPDLAEAHFQLGVLELREERTVAAIDRLETAVALDPEHEGAFYNLARAYSMAGLEEKAASARSAYERILDKRRSER